MAEDQDESQKTEEPTSKKLEDAHKKGQVPKSQEVTHWFSIFGGALVVAIFAGQLAGDLRLTLVSFIEFPHQIAADQAGLVLVFGNLAVAVAKLLALPIIVIMIAALAGNLIQHKPVISADRMKPKLSKLSLPKGLKRQFSSRSLVEFSKGMAKLTVVAVIVIWLVLPEADRLGMLVTYDPIDLVGAIQVLALRMFVGVLVVMGFIAALDFAYQKMQFTKQQRMTKQEIKDEHKQAEGDPMVKAKLRQIRMERGRHRMMLAVPDADVIITNPTHYAVALKYDESSMDAPKLVAKGTDQVALRIRKVATEADVAIVENPPLARAIFASVELDQEIPPEHYKAVAEIIGFVMGLRSGAGGNKRSAAN